MIYVKNNRGSRGRTSLFGRWLFILAALALVALVLLVLVWPHILGALFTSVAAPFWRVRTAAEMGLLSQTQTLVAENEDLKRQLALIETQLQTVKAVEAENAELKSIMGWASTSPDHILSAVISRPPMSAYDTFIIDAGSDLGIMSGDLVHAAGSVPVGRVADVFGKTAKVVLFTSPGEKYEVQIGQNHIQATAVGRGGGQYTAELPRDLVVNQGDVVVAPSVTTRPFGIVSSVIADPTLPFQTVLFAPPESIYGMRWVWIERTGRQ